MNVRVLIRPKSGAAEQEVVVPGESPFVLGRGNSSAAVLDGPGISREHVEVSLDGANILVTDLSVNGAWINGKRLPPNEKHRVKPGEIVELPGYEVQFQPIKSAPDSSPALVPPGPAPLPGLAPLMTSDAAAPSSAAARSSLKATVFAFIESFSFLDRLLIAVAALTFALVVFYLLSY